MCNRYHPTEGRQMVCMLGRGRISLIECLLRSDSLHWINSLAGVNVRIVPGDCNDMVTVIFRDPCKKDVQVSQDILRRCLYDGELGFTINEIAYVTVTGGDMLNFEICLPVPYSFDSPYDWNEFRKKANVIIMLVDTSHMGIECERREIEQLFAYRNLKNVFFLVRHFEIWEEEDKDKFFDSLENHLGSVFVDWNGNFQQELYDRRVFLVDLELAKAARLGETRRYRKGVEYIERKVNRLEDSLSGFQSFETALKTFLRTQKWNSVGKYKAVEKQ